MPVSRSRLSRLVSSSVRQFAYTMPFGKFALCGVPNTNTHPLYHYSLLNISTTITYIMPRASRNAPRRQLTPVQRAYIIGLRDGGMRPAEIARKLNRPLSTITTTLYRAPARINQESIHRKGRPRKYTPRDERHILWIVRRNPYIQYKQLIKESDVNIKKT